MIKKENYTIRHASLSDIDAVSELERLCFSKEDGATRESFEKRLLVFPEHFWLLEVEGVLVSMVNGMTTDVDTLLDEMYEDAREQGRKGLVLTCKEHMVHYYEKFGFVNEGLSESIHGGAQWYHMRYQMKISFG